MHISRWTSNRPVRRCLALLLTLAAGSSAAQQLPPIFADTRRDLLPGKTLAEFPRMTFLENLLVDDSGIVFTSHEDGKLYRLKPGSTHRLLATLPGKITGIAPRANGGFLVTAFDRNGQPVVFELDAGAKVKHVAPIQGAQFLNGIERIGATDYLIADSYRGVIWRYDSKLKVAKVWLDSPLLKRADENNPLPAANGIRKRGREVVVSNTAKMTMVRVPLRADGTAGEPILWKDKLNVDDFAIASDGSILAATHIYNSLIRIDTTGNVAVIGEAAAGLTGSTSVALSRDGRTAYVSTNGGMFLPSSDGVQPGRIVAVELGRATP